MKNILVTGGAGFIGSHTIVTLIESGFNPIIADNLVNSERFVLDRINQIVGKEVPFYEIDICDKAALQKLFSDYKLDGVIHFAAHKAVGESVEKPLKYYHNNLVSLMHLMEVMEEHKVSNLVFSSSCTVYGQPEKLPVDERAPIVPAESPYGNTKQIGEEIITDVAKSNPNFKSTLLRYFNPIGAHPSALIGELPIGVPKNLVPFITQTAAGLRNELTVYGDDYDTVDGTCIRDYIHVLDLAQAHVDALVYMHKTNDQISTFNVGTGNGNTVLELIKAFEKVTGVPLKYKIGPRRTGDVEQVWAQADKVKETLKWQPKHSLEKALADAWKWQQATLNNEKGS